MPKLSRNIWERLRKASIINTYDPALRNEQIRKAGPYKLMSIRGIGVRSAKLLLKNAGWDMDLAHLKNIYNKLHIRTQFEDVKARPKEGIVRNKQTYEAPQKEEKIAKNVDKRERRYIALIFKPQKQFDELFKLVEKNGGIPYDARKPHKILHLTINPPQNILFRDALAKLYGIVDYEMPSTFEITGPNKFSNNPKLLFFGNLNVSSKFITTPHVTFGEFDNDDKCIEVYNKGMNIFNKYKGLKMELESIAIVRKDYGIEYVIPLTALKDEKRFFIPEQMRAFLEFLGHKNPIKYQVFKPDNKGVKQGSGRNTYVQNIDEVINLAKIDNGKGIICVAIGEHGNKQTEDITNITKLLALVTDVDVKKDRKINYVSSRADHLHAINIAYTVVKKELEGMGFKVGLINDSGNGAHVFIKVNIDIPEGTTQKNLADAEFYRKIIAIENRLKEKLKETNDEIVNIDCISKDAVRRIKMPGAINKKDFFQAEDRMCRIIYKADDYAEEANNIAFFKIKPAEEEKSTQNFKQTENEPPFESKAVLTNDEVERILGNDPKLKALFEGKVICHGEDRPLEFKDGSIYSKSRSEAENSLVSGLVANGIRNFEQIDGIMMQSKIGKWQEDRRGGYKRKTFEKALKFIKTTKIYGKTVSDFERIKQTITKIKK